MYIHLDSYLKWHDSTSPLYSSFSGKALLVMPLCALGVIVRMVQKSANYLILL